MRYFTMVLATLVSLYIFKSCSSKNREIRLLKTQVEDLKLERPDIWIESCKSAVYRSCFYADCAVTPIEIMQEKLCNQAPEGL